MGEGGGRELGNESSPSLLSPSSCHNDGLMLRLDVNHIKERSSLDLDIISSFAVASVATR